MTKTPPAVFLEIAMKMQVMKAELGKLGLYATMHLMDDATSKLGWEVAEISKGGNNRDRPIKKSSKKDF